MYVCSLSNTILIIVYVYVNTWLRVCVRYTLIILTYVSYFHVLCMSTMFKYRCCLRRTMCMFARMCVCVSMYVRACVYLFVYVY